MKWIGHEWGEEDELRERKERREKARRRENSVVFCLEWPTSEIIGKRNSGRTRTRGEEEKKPLIPTADTHIFEFSVY